VRYRYDGERRNRIKTVELIEEETPWIAAGAVYLLKIDSKNRLSGKGLVRVPIRLSSGCRVTTNIVSSI